MELTVGAFEKSFVSEDGSVVFRLSVPDLRFMGGGTTFIMGHNGSGKSVFLDILQGSLDSDSGSIEVALDGCAVGLRSSVVARVPQDPTEILALELTVCENLALRRESFGLAGHIFPLATSRVALTSRLSSHSTLEGKCDERVASLSVGQRQRLAFLCATVREQPVLVLDEYLAAADLGTSRTLRELARSYATDRDAVVIVVSHDPGIALEDADRILILRQGLLTHDLSRGGERWDLQFLRDVI